MRSAGAFAVFVDRGQIQKRVSIAVDKILEQPRDLGLGGGVFDIVDKARQSQNLAFAEELLRLVELEKLNFLCQRSRQVGLLHALVVAEFVLAKLEHLAVIEPDGQSADEQQRAENEPQNAHASLAQALPRRWTESWHLNSQF